MSSGPQTERVLYGKSCSHFLSTPLKVYLPLLELENDGVVLLDEKAGADGASTGIVSGVDVGVVVSEPSVHGTKTANQIAKLLEFFGTPYIFVGNKVQSKEDKVFLKDQLDADPGAYIESNQQIKRDPFTSEKRFAEVVEDIYRLAQEKNNEDRLERTIEKFERNASFQS
jgi:CO dehydrogenase nickel-insertion accessory protein CooC1